MLPCQKNGCSPTGDKVLFRSKVIMVNVVFNPPCMVSGHKHGKCGECKEPAVWRCFLENKIVIAFMRKLKQIHVNPRSNCPCSQQNDPPRLAAESNCQCNLSRSKCDTPECCARCIAKEPFDLWMLANHLFCSIAVPDGIRFVRVTDSITNVNFIARKHRGWSSKNTWVKPNFLMRWCVSGE